MNNDATKPSRDIVSGIQQTTALLLAGEHVGVSPVYTKVNSDWTWPCRMRTGLTQISQPLSLLNEPSRSILIWPVNAQLGDQ